MFHKIRKSIESAVARHSAGATVLHRGPFSSLEMPEDHNSLSDEIISTYVAPFYLNNKGEDSYIQAYKAIEMSIEPEIISSLLAEVNWRPRSVAADFVSLKKYTEFEDQIGKLLLRSDVCYSGHNYCLALALFSTQKSIGYLHEYLEYYLTKKDLYFDQGSAMAALNYIEKKEPNDLLSQHRDSWHVFTKDKEGWDLQHYIERFEREIDQLNLLSSECS